MSDMTAEARRQKIREIAEHLSDRQYQQATWFGQGSRISSPEEMYCELFDDAQFERFLGEGLLTPQQLAAGGALKKSMEDCALPDLPDPTAVIDDPGWEAVRSAAKRFLASLLSGDGTLPGN